jgi:alkylhydroperoxidase family enzyme
MDINAAVGGDRGLSRAKIDAAIGVRGRDEAELSPRERLALEYADRVSATPVDVSDDFFADLAREFSDREIVELTATIAHENYNSKFNRPLRIESNNFCELPLPPPEKVLELVKTP